MQATCKKCGKKHSGVWETIRPICVKCYAKAKGVKHESEAYGSYCKTGRPPGTTQYEERKKDDNHHMTPKAHAFIKTNKALIEKMAREHFEIQWQMFNIDE